MFLAMCMWHWHKQTAIYIHNWLQFKWRLKGGTLTLSVNVIHCNILYFKKIGYLQCYSVTDNVVYKNKNLDKYKRDIFDTLW